MGKIKVHELAKKMGISSKEALEKAKELGIDVKSHLSIIEDEDAKKIESGFGKMKKENVEKNIDKNVDKNSGPVIIRRQVIMENEEKVDKQKPTQTAKKGVGFVENERKKDYNIVYRNKQAKPMSVSELFGLPKKEEPKPEVKKEMVEKVEDIEEKSTVPEKVEETVTEKKETPDTVVKQENNNQTKPYNRENNNQNRPYDREKNYNNQRPYNREGNGYNNQNRPYNRENNSYNNQNRPYNRDNNYQNNRPFNRDNRNNGSFDNRNKPYNRENNNFNNQNRPFNNRNNQRRPLDEKGVEKNIKNIMSADVGEKENVRDYNRAIDKQKDNKS